MYISNNSGHHHASLAIENAIHELSDDVETLNVNSFCYTNPILEKIINKAYLSIIKRKPEVWGYLYDNPKVVKKTRRLRESIHKYNSHKMQSLLDEFKPQAVICTQAFPCGIVADLKKTYGSNILLAGVLTDYAPHSYWIYDNVDMYFVPSEETKARLLLNGIPYEKIHLTGIPIDVKFKKIYDREKILNSLGLSRDIPVILVMGGSQGLGPIREIITMLDNSDINLQIIVATGSNKRLKRCLERRRSAFKKKIVILGYTENICELMDVSSLLISKPGGITISEALAKGLPILILKPIPGHEEMNTNQLLKHGVAVKLGRLQDVVTVARELLSNTPLLQNMRERARKFSRPSSASDIAKRVLERIM